MAKRVVAALRESTRDGELVVVSDASSCTEGFAHILHDAGLGYRTEDAVAFVERVVLPQLGRGDARGGVPRAAPDLLLDADGAEPRAGGCSPESSRRMSRTPDAWGCCGFAGDRGMLHPELTASATAAEAAEVAEIGAQAHASCNRTCEVGMTRATGAEYRHVLELLEEATRPGRV